MLKTLRKASCGTSTDPMASCVSYQLFVFKEFAFTRNVTTVTLGKYVLTKSLDISTSHDFVPNSCLNWHLKLLTRDDFS